MFCSPPRKISIIVPLVVQIVISMIGEHRHRGSAEPLPQRQLEHLAAQPRRLVVDAEHAEQVVDHPVGLVEPVMSSIGRMRFTSPDVRNSTSQISVMAIEPVTDGK